MASPQSSGTRTAAARGQHTESDTRGCQVDTQTTIAGASLQSVSGMWALRAVRSSPSWSYPTESKIFQETKFRRKGQPAAKIKHFCGEKIAHFGPMPAGGADENEREGAPEEGASVQIKVEIELVGSGAAAHAPVDSVYDHEPAGRRCAVEVAPLLGGAPLAALGIETAGNSARWQLWRRCSLAKLGLYVSAGLGAVLIAMAVTQESFFGAFLRAAWPYLAIVGLVLSCVTWCWLRWQQAHAPVVLSTPRQQLRAEGGDKVRILALNICLLPAGINFSGKCLCDGNDQKARRLRQLADLLDDFDIVLLNELWGSPWSGHHGRFTETALQKGFNVVSDPIGAVSNTGNMILSRFPLRDATSIIFRHHAGWQSFVPNGVLHATCQLPRGEPLHLFTTHLQCTTAPPQELLPPASPDVHVVQQRLEAGFLDLLEKGEQVSGGRCDSVRKGQLTEIKAFMDSVIPTQEDKFLLGGDLNIEGGSPEYLEMTRIFGRPSLCAPDFPTTYNTDSFLTPPGWRGVEYSVCLDHMVTNLEVESFEVLQDDLSDHRAITCVVIPPDPAEQSPATSGSYAPPVDATAARGVSTGLQSVEGLAIALASAAGLQADVAQDGARQMPLATRPSLVI